MHTFTFVMKIVTHCCSVPAARYVLDGIHPSPTQYPNYIWTRVRVERWAHTFSCSEVIYRNFRFPYCIHRAVCRQMLSYISMEFASASEKKRRKRRRNVWIREMWTNARPHLQRASTMWKENCLLLGAIKINVYILIAHCAYFNWILKLYNCHFQTNKIGTRRLFVGNYWLLICGVCSGSGFSRADGINSTVKHQMAWWMPWIQAIEIRKKLFLTSLHLL